MKVRTVGELIRALDDPGDDAPVFVAPEPHRFGTAVSPLETVVIYALWEQTTPDSLDAP